MAEGPTEPVQGKGARTPRADGEATYRRILDAAGELFAERGFAEVTNKQIAAAAGVDLASINYHFGTRSGLYSAVLAQAHRQLIQIEELQRLVSASEPAAQKLRHIMEYTIHSATQERAWPIRVLAREMLAPSSHLPVLAQQEGLPKLKLMLGVISELTGLPPDDPKLPRYVLSLLAPCAVLLVAGPAFSRVSGIPLSAMIDELIEHLHEFGLGGIERLASKR